MNPATLTRPRVRCLNQLGVGRDARKRLHIERVAHPAPGTDLPGRLQGGRDADNGDDGDGTASAGRRPRRPRSHPRDPALDKTADDAAASSRGDLSWLPALTPGQPLTLSYDSAVAMVQQVGPQPSRALSSHTSDGSPATPVPVSPRSRHSPRRRRKPRIAPRPPSGISSRSAARVRASMPVSKGCWWQRCRRTRQRASAAARCTTPSARARQREACCQRTSRRLIGPSSSGRIFTPSAGPSHSPDSLPRWTVDQERVCHATGFRVLPRR